jgi:hypothetical protein
MRDRKKKAEEYNKLHRIFSFIICLHISLFIKQEEVVGKKTLN